MWNKVNELSRKNLPQQQIVTSSFHQCQQDSASSQCQCHSSNILVNAKPTHPPLTQSYNTKTLIHITQKKRSHHGSAYTNIKHYLTIASRMHSTIYRTSSSVTYGPAERQTNHLPYFINFSTSLYTSVLNPPGIRSPRSRIILAFSTATLTFGIKTDALGLLV